ncbi:MAG TPA: phosphatase PAP2 family protein [Caulobacteraceae bacterium]
MFHILNSHAGHSSLDNLVWHLDQNAIPRELVLIAPYIFYWFADKTAETRSKLIAGLFGAFLAVIAARLVAHFAPFELRPMYDAASGFHRLATDRALDMENWSSFPSDTAAFSVALTLGLFSVQRGASLVLTAFSMVLFGVSRIYLGIHYPIDVLAGWMIGGGCAAVVSLPFVRQIGQTLLRLETWSAPLFYAASTMILTEIGQMFDNVRGVMRLFHLLA